MPSLPLNPAKFNFTDDGGVYADPSVLAAVISVYLIVHNGMAPLISQILESRSMDQQNDRLVDDIPLIAVLSAKRSAIRCDFNKCLTMYL